MLAHDCGDLSPLFHAKLAEPDFGGVATFIEAKRKFGPILRRGTAQQASPRESGDKSHAVHRLRHPLLSFNPMDPVYLRPLGGNQAKNRYVQPLRQGVTQILVALGVPQVLGLRSS